MLRKASLACVLVVSLALLGACERRVPEEPSATTAIFTPVEFDALPGWQDDRLEEVVPALLRSCERLLRQPDERRIGPQGLAGTVADWREPCEALPGLRKAGTTTVRAWFEASFVPYAVGSETDEVWGLFTGYYEAELEGARQSGDGYPVPLYAPPDDLVVADLQDFRADLPRERLVGRVENGRFVPYFTRAEIENGQLKDRADELLWVKDPVDAFILHVQGSGRVQLPDGAYVRVGYAASNGRPFYAIGRALIDEGHISREHSSMQAIREWLRANPQRAREIMQRNERFIFFREIDGEGPIGAQGAPLTPGRSLAVDPDHLPLGAPVWLATTWPGDDAPLQRLMVAQDTGSAIKGVVRGDFFWGTGESALDYAGRMRQQGRYWLLLPRSVSERRLRTS